MNQCNGSYSPSRPLHVTILAPGWRLWSLFPSRELAEQLAKFPQVKVTYLVPENSCNELDKRDAASYGVTIVEAKKQPGFDDPIEWLSFPPKDLTTDIVVGVGEKLSKMAQRFKKHHKCKTIFVATDPVEEAQKRFQQLVVETMITYQKLQLRSNVDPPGIISMADLPVAVGPKMADKLSASLSRQKKRVFKLTPGILGQFADITHADSYRTKFRILVTGSDDPRNFHQEGLDIAAKAVAGLNNRSYELVYVGAAEGKQAGFAEKFCHCGVSKYQLTIRSVPKDEEELKKWLCGADLAIMPSGEQEFGMLGLAALSSGLPVLVHGASGLGEALRPVKFGTSSIVDSDDAKEWSKAIKRVQETKRVVRLEQAELLQKNYNEEYSWQKQCGALVEEMLRMVSGMDLHSFKLTVSKYF